MSQENVEIVRAVHAGWARGDFGAAQELFAPDFSWEQPAEAVEPGSRRGPEVRDALRNLFDVYDNYRVEASEFIDGGGDEVVVVARSKGTAKASRMELDQLFAFIWTVRGGRLARLRVFTDRERALQAAGLTG
jgi:ketosteroid isomerase-like protein